MCRWMMDIWGSPICCTKDSMVEDRMQAVNRFVWNKNNVVGGLTGENKQRKVYGMSTQTEALMVKLLKMSYTYDLFYPTCIG